MSNLAENYGIRKEEILEKSRNTLIDEGYENAELRGYKVGTAVASVMTVFLLGFSVFTRQFAMIYPMLAIFFAPLCGKSIVIYQFSKRKLYLVTAICMAIVVVGNSILFALSLLRGL